MFDAMLSSGRSVLIAAPSAAEILRGAPKTPLPRTRLVRVVAFDGRAAEILASKFPSAALVKWRDAQNRPHQYIKYDAMIVACAVRHGARAFVTVDENLENLPAERR